MGQHQHGTSASHRMLRHIAPKSHFLFGSVNDLSKPPGAVHAAVRDTIDELRDIAPDCLVVGGMNSALGVESWTADNWAVNDAVKQGFAEAGGKWLSALELPFDFSGAVIGNAAQLVDNVALGRPGNGGDPSFLAGQSGFRVNTSSSTPDSNLRLGATVEIGTGATRERGGHHDICHLWRTVRLRVRWQFPLCPRGRRTGPGGRA